MKTFATQTLSEIKFALENGHTNVTMGTEKDGTFYIMGAFGYIVIEDSKLVEEVKTLVAQYTKVEKSEAELLKEFFENESTITLTKTETVAPNKEDQNELTAKESRVVNALIECSYELGLPVSVDEIKDITKMSKRSIVGVVSSLYKKNIVEEYDINEGLNVEEFTLTEAAYNKYQ